MVKELRKEGSLGKNNNFLNQFLEQISQKAFIDKDIDDNDLKLLLILRNNPRQGLRELSNKTGLSTSSVYNRILKLRDTGLLRHTILVKPEFYDYNYHVLFIVRTNDKSLWDNLMNGVLGDFINRVQLITPFDQYSQPNNNLIVDPVLSNKHRASDYNVLVEAYFRTLLEMKFFMDKISDFSHSIDTILVVEEKKKESFLNNFLDETMNNSIKTCQRWWE